MVDFSSKTPFILICIFLSLFIMSCTNNLDDEEETTIRRGMYQDYKLDEDILFSAKLPVLSIQTDKNKQIADKENWISAKMEVKNAPVKNWNFEDLSVSELTPNS